MVILKKSGASITLAALIVNTQRVCGFNKRIKAGRMHPVTAKVERSAIRHDLGMGATADTRVRFQYHESESTRTQRVPRRQTSGSSADHGHIYRAAHNAL